MQPEQDAVRAAYDAVAEDYAELLRDELASKPLDRALLAAFAQEVAGGPVLDAGCGPGRIAGHLASLGLDVAGIDLSPGMVEVARRHHPALRFDVGTLTGLDLPDASFGGVLAWYSLIHLRPDELRLAVSELARVLRPGGHLLTAFQVGSGTVRLDRPYGHDVELHATRLDPDEVVTLLSDAGLAVIARTVREPESWEQSPQAYLLARCPSSMLSGR
ncbi:class I SAM-dependent methyltransferase [Blastococcus sp. LR1]|uniref:class I SAM-dependent DNA methyltransferase n=1 Tax=Blastococcus sp. LR1 TaxID=2877000 RepID=UPI001CCD0EBD|nr:class I SAM-dependent methyltransferase [Blastococcus sp. LR1]MCA0143386.1 methyltransferase domain-containing protein [Blastococcus sp. LR1]